VINLNKLSERLTHLRKNKGLTLRELSDELGEIKEATISRYEHGRREPKLDTLLKIADYFDCSVDYLLGRKNYRNIEEVIEKPEKINEIEMMYNIYSKLKKQDIDIDKLKDTVVILEKVEAILSIP